MTVEMRITNEARAMHTWIHDTYVIGPQVKVWCRQLADGALPPAGLGFDFSRLWGDAREIAENPDEAHVALVVAEVGWELYQKIRAQLLKRQEAGGLVRAASGVFEASVGGRSIDVEVTTVYEVDPKARTVAFLFFDTCAPSLAQAEDPAARVRWA